MGVMGALTDLAAIVEVINQKEDFKASLTVVGESAKILIKRQTPKDVLLNPVFHYQVFFGGDDWQKEIANIKGNLMEFSA